MISFLQVITVFLISISNAHSKGYPWDWQSTNAKIPDVGERDRAYSERGGRRVPEAIPVHSNITVLESHSASLPCRIQFLGEHTVSWLRSKDTSILSVGLHQFSTDKRISVVQLPQPQNKDITDFTLQIQSVGKNDIGWYDCQVNTEPKISQKSYLDVVEQSQRDSPSHTPRMIPQMQEFLQSYNLPKVTISGPSEVWREEGEAVTLECTGHRQPSSIRWSFNGRLLRQRPNLEVETSGSTSWLKVRSLGRDDEGIYACFTDERSKPASVTLKLGASTVDGEAGGPVALANVKLRDESEASVLAQEIEARLASAEAKLAKLELQVNSLLLRLGEDGGAKELASRVSSSTSPESTSVLLVSLLSIVWDRF